MLLYFYILRHVFYNTNPWDHLRLLGYVRIIIIIITIMCTHEWQVKSHYTFSSPLHLISILSELYSHGGYDLPLHSKEGWISELQKGKGAMERGLAGSKYNRTWFEHEFLYFVPTSWFLRVWHLYYTHFFTHDLYRLMIGKSFQ